MPVGVKTKTGSGKFTMTITTPTKVERTIELVNVYRVDQLCGDCRYRKEFACNWAPNVHPLAWACAKFKGK